MRRLDVAFAVICALVVLLTGCGSDEIPSYVDGDEKPADAPVIERLDYFHHVEGNSIISTVHISFKNQGTQKESSVDFTGMITQEEVTPIETWSKEGALDYRFKKEQSNNLIITVDLAQELPPGEEGEIYLKYAVDGAITGNGSIFTAKALQLSPTWRKVPTYASTYEFHIPEGKVFRDSFPPKTKVSDGNIVRYTTHVHQAFFSVEYGDTKKTMTFSVVIYGLFALVAVMAFLSIWRLRHSA